MSNFYLVIFMVFKIFSSFSVRHAFLLFVKTLATIAILPCILSYFALSQILSFLYSNRNVILVLPFFSFFPCVMSKTTLNINILFRQFPILDTLSSVSFFPFDCQTHCFTSYIASPTK